MVFVYSSGFQPCIVTPQMGRELWTNPGPNGHSVEQKKSEILLPHIGAVCTPSLGFVTFT